MLDLWSLIRRRKGPDLDDAIRDYLAACAIEGKTDRTIGAYRETLGQFLVASRELGLRRQVGRFTSQDVYRFLSWVQARGVSLGTRHRRHRETRAFFAWCKRMGHVDENPFDRVPNVRHEQKVVRPFTQEEVERLLACCDDSTEYGCRNRTIVLVLLDTGLRSQELQRLEMTDLDLDRRRLHVKYGKGRKQRVVPFTDAPAEALAAYLDRYRGARPGRLFLGVDRGHGRRAFNFYHLGTILRRLGQQSGVHANPPRFRHTFATWSIEAGAREIDVQYLLGHSTSVMTRRYAATYDASKAALNHHLFSPLSRLRCKTN